MQNSSGYVKYGTYKAVKTVLHSRCQAKVLPATVLSDVTYAYESHQQRILNCYLSQQMAALLLHKNSLMHKLQQLGIMSSGDTTYRLDYNFSFSFPFVCKAHHAAGSASSTSSPSLMNDVAPTINAI